MKNIHKYQQLFITASSIVIIIALSRCTSYEESNSIDLNNNNPVHLSDMFSDVKVIQLETKPESIIGQPTNIEYYKGHYYIGDTRNQEVFCFDENGKFIYKISGRGKGPEEYSNVSNFSIDRFNDRILLLDAPLQRVLIFDLNGNFVTRESVLTDETMGYNDIFSLNDSILLLTSINRSQLVFYSKKEERVINTTFPIHENSISPYFNTYQLASRTYTLPSMKQNIMDVTEIKPTKHFTWCFGENNNTERQINNFFSEMEKNPDRTDDIHWAIKQNLLNQYILWVHETNRFKIAIVEYDDDFKHVVIDKKGDEDFVFDYFKEGISIALSIKNEDRIIAYKHRSYSYYDNIGRSLAYYNKDYLSEDCRKLIENHNIETDNPFLVVYTFKE